MRMFQGARACACADVCTYVYVCACMHLCMPTLVSIPVQQCVHVCADNNERGSAPDREWWNRRTQSSSQAKLRHQKNDHSLSSSRSKNLATPEKKFLMDANVHIGHRVNTTLVNALHQSHHLEVRCGIATLIWEFGVQRNWHWVQGSCFKMSTKSEQAKFTHLQNTPCCLGSAVLFAVPHVMPCAVP